MWPCSRCNVIWTACFIIGDRRAIDRQLPVEPAQRDVVVRQFGLQAQAGGCQRRGARLGEALLGARAVADLAPEIGLPRRPRQNLVAGLPNGLVGVRGAEQPLLGLLVVGQQSVGGHLREQAGPRLGGHVAGLRVCFGHRGEIGVLRGQLLLELVEPGIIEPLPPRAARQCVERMGDFERRGPLIARRQDVLRRPIRRGKVAAAKGGKSRQERTRQFQRRSGGRRRRVASAANGWPRSPRRPCVRLRIIRRVGGIIRIGDARRSGRDRSWLHPP